MSLFIKGITAGELLRVFELARIGANNCTIGRGVIVTELPDHGDLIDKNRMIDVLHQGIKYVSESQKWGKDENDTSFCQGVMVGYTNSIVALDGAPVVISAEVEKDEE